MLTFLICCCLIIPLFISSYSWLRFVRDFFLSLCVCVVFFRRFPTSSSMVFFFSSFSCIEIVATATIISLNSISVISSMLPFLFHRIVYALCWPCMRARTNEWAHACFFCLCSRFSVSFHFAVKWSSLISVRAFVCDYSYHICRKAWCIVHSVRWAWYVFQHCFGLRFDFIPPPPPSHWLPNRMGGMYTHS